MFGALFRRNRAESYVWICRRCLCLKLTLGGFWKFQPAPNRAVCAECEFVHPSEAPEAASVWPAWAYLRQLYDVLRDANFRHLNWSADCDHLVGEMDRRLKLGPIRGWDLPKLEDHGARRVEDAIAWVRQRALPATPTISPRRAELEYESLQRSWACKGLVRGSVRDVTDIVGRNLIGDAESSQFKKFFIKAPREEFCTQVATILRDPDAPGGQTFKGYRIWRTSGGLCFCGAGDDVILTL